MTRQTQIAILSDSRLFAEALCSCLSAENRIEIVSAANTVYDLLVRSRGRPIDVLLADLRVPFTLATEIICDIKMMLPATGLVVLGSDSAQADAVAWIEAGATARLDDDASYESLLEAIQAAAEGRGLLYSPEVMTEVIGRITELQKAFDRKLDEQQLTERQREVAQWLRLGLGNKQIARLLGCKQSSVKKHVSEVLRKLGLPSRGDLDLRTLRRRNGKGG